MRLFGFGAVLGSWLAIGCGSSAVAPEVARTAPVITKPLRASEPGEQLPAVDAARSPESLVPASSVVVVGLPAQAGASALLAGPIGELVQRAIVERAHIDASALRILMDASAGGVVFGRSAAELGAIVRVANGAVAEDLAKALDLVPTGPDTWRTPLRYAASRPALHVDRFAKSGLVVVTNDDRLRASVLERAAGRGAPFARKLGALPDPSELWLSLDLATLARDDDAMAPGSRLDASLGAGGITIDYVQKGEGAPRLGRVLAASAPTALAKLPDGALGGIAWSVRRSTKATLQDVLVEVERAAHGGLSGVVADVLRERAHRSVAEVDRALGDEVAFGVYAPVGESGDGALDALTWVATIDTRDDAVAKQLVDALAARPRPASGKLGAARDATERTVEVVADKGRILVVAGPSRSATKLLKELRKPTRTIGAKAFGGDAARAGEAVHAYGFVDLAAVTALLPADDRPPPAAPGASSVRSVRLVLRPADDGLEAAFRSSDRDEAGQGIRVLGALASYGVRRYVESAKAAEARNVLGAIARSAITSYEREMPPPPGASLTAPSTVVHRLCDSAPPVPTGVPKGTTYQPSPRPGADFQTGTDTAGWRCLRFEMTMPHYYRYEYRRGGPTKGPARGGPDPGPNGFEVSAEGDLDGDGKTSLFTLVGTVDRANAAVTMRPEVWVADERE